MKLALLALLILLLTTGSAAAQSPLFISPDTLYYSTDSENVVTLTNISDEAVAIDSIAIRFEGARAYTIEFSTPDSTYYPHYFNASYEINFSVGADLGAGLSARLHVTGFDPCIICSSGKHIPGADTLLVYAAGSDIPDTTLLDLSTYVATEPEPLSRSGLKLAAFPNPTSGDVTLQIETVVASGIEITVYDALGRLVRHQRLAAGAHPEIVIQMDGLPAGAYFVQARTDGGGQLVQSFALFR